MNTEGFCMEALCVFIGCTSKNKNTEYGIDCEKMNENIPKAVSFTHRLLVYMPVFG